MTPGFMTLSVSGKDSVVEGNYVFDVVVFVGEAGG